MRAAGRQAPKPGRLAAQATGPRRPTGILRSVKHGLLRALGTVVAALALPVDAPAQQAAAPERDPSRRSAVTLQDLPRVRIDDAEGADRVPGAKKPGRPQTRSYTFLSATPGAYRRVTRIANRLSYVEHLERGPRSVTFQGGLRVSLGK